ncbi:hypothetical protein RchiOBHm_Chr6g0262911 [Rosa chinensis]|uniref:Uncharacterized protein n=1 Tax=Rosa chinensis TaxID=74649 RepID=A0A2P6PNR9_ROSCH|nr:UPF0496 protein At4g34320 [Rosa chinensis]PRQ23579.1 hypothetical protein RchiOBHm_Chr6g0262911 [Rosa chinensis]
MGRVQAKPESGRAGLERKTSLAKVVPINAESRPTGDLCKDFEDLMRSYQADCKDDKDLQDFDAELSSSAKEVFCSTGFDRLEKYLKYLKDSDEKMKEVILSSITQIREAEDVQAMTENEKILDDLIKMYTNNSGQTHQLCGAELRIFIDSARAVHSCITNVLERGVSKKFNESVRKYRLDAEAVAAKVKSLRDQHTDMLHQLKDQIQKCDKKLERTRTLKKVVNVVFIGMLSGLFVCTIMAAAMAAPPVASALTTHPCIAGVIAGGAVGYACSSVLKEGRHWLLTLIQDCESTLEAHKGVIQSMEAGTGVAIKELDDIICLVEKVIAKGNDPVLSNLCSANDKGRVDVEIDEKEIIEKKRTEFHQAIEELDKKREDCLRVVEKASKKVQREYDELKRSPVLKTKIKK